MLSDQSWGAGQSAPREKMTSVEIDEFENINS